MKWICVFAWIREQDGWFSRGKDSSKSCLFVINNEKVLKNGKFRIRNPETENFEIS